MEDYYNTPTNLDNEILVLNHVHDALRTLPTQDAMVRVLEWVCNKLYIRAQFELSKRERLLRESREICGYVESSSSQEQWIEESEEEVGEEVADLELSDDVTVIPEEKDA